MIYAFVLFLSMFECPSPHIHTCSFIIIFILLLLFAKQKGQILLLISMRKKGRYFACQLCPPPALCYCWGELQICNMTLAFEIFMIYGRHFFLTLIKNKKITILHLHEHFETSY